MNYKKFLDGPLETHSSIAHWEWHQVVMNINSSSSSSSSLFAFFYSLQIVMKFFFCRTILIHQMKHQNVGRKYDIMIFVASRRDAQNSKTKIDVVTMSMIYKHLFRLRHMQLELKMFLDQSRTNDVEKVLTSIELQLKYSTSSYYKHAYK